LKLTKSIKQCWTEIVSGSSPIPNQERQMLEVYFYIGAITTVGILNGEKNNFEEDLAGLERSIKEVNEQIQRSVGIVQYH